MQHFLRFVLCSPAMPGHFLAVIAHLDDPGRFPEFVAAELASCGFDSEVVDRLVDAAAKVAASRPAWETFHLAAEAWIEGRSEPPTSGTPKEMQPLLVVSGFPLMRERHRAAGVPEEVTTATACDLQRWLREGLEKTGRAEIQHPDWFRSHLHHGLLEIGRLQFLAAPFGVPYRLFRTADNSPLAVAEAGLTCSPDGWLPKEAVGFQTVYRPTDDGGLVAHRVDHRTGAISAKAEAFPGPLVLVADRETPVLHIHIPSGPGLTPAACRESLARAGEIFGRVRPEWKLPLFCCTSWLCDPELGKCLPPDSRIVQFVRLFHPLATPGTNFRQLVERVLDGCADWQTFEPATSLQRAVLGHLQSGGTFRTTTGYILRNS